MSKDKIFFAYSSQPPNLGSVIEDTVQKLRAYAGTNRTYETWGELDIPGRFAAAGILDKIDAAKFVVADITRLNFNVIFEIGYTIGRGKRAFIVINEALSPPNKEITRLGIFDTLGYLKYSNSNELLSAINKANADPQHFPKTVIDTNAPVFIVDTHYKTDASARVRAKIANARINVRVFDPEEQPRLSALDVHRGVSSSVGIVVHFLASHATDYEFNNLRAAFVAGVALGMSKVTLLLQEEGDPVPIDYRDLVNPYKRLSDIDKDIADFAPRIMEGLQGLRPDYVPPDQGFLASLDLGASAAENEASKLRYYYLQTDHYTAAISGKVRLVIGRKGSGKTALFLQSKDKLTQVGNSVVLDLKPEGHQLKRFKDNVLRAMGEAVQEHVAAAFWEYVLELELCHKILEADRARHLRDHTLFEPYKNLLAQYPTDHALGEGDFSERLTRVVERLTTEFEKHPNFSTGAPLKTEQVSSIIYRHDLPRLRRALTEYLALKENHGFCWITSTKAGRHTGWRPSTSSVRRSNRQVERNEKVQQ